MTFDVTLERDRGDGETELVTFEDATDLLNPSVTSHAMVTRADGEREKVPQATVISIDQ